MLLRTTRSSLTAVGEFFGQPTDESLAVFTAFAETFDWTGCTLDEALRVMLLVERFDIEP